MGFDDQGNDSTRGDNKHTSGTQQEVDTYVNSLESEVFQEGLRLRKRRAEQRREPAALVAVRRSHSSGLFWYVVAAVIACVWWLLRLFL